MRAEEVVATGDRGQKESSIIFLFSLFQEFGVFLSVRILKMAVFAEDQRALVIGEDADAVAIVLLNRGLVELELPQHATKGG